MGCSDDDGGTKDVEPPLGQAGEVVASEYGDYFIRFEASSTPIPFNEYFDLTVEVFRDEALSEPVEDAELGFDARVEMLGAKMPTRPIVEWTGAGKFVVRGLLMHVPRPWELRFDVSEDGAGDEARALVDPTRGFEQGVDPTGFFSEQEVRSILSMSPEGGPLLPASPSNAYADDPEAAKLGQFLYFDKSLSKNGEVSCASCHAPDKGFADGRRLARGIGETGRGAPTLLNAAFNRWQFWDGRTDSLWSQALQPLEADMEHGTNRMAVAHVIASSPAYREAYEAIFGELGDFSDAARFPADARPIPAEPERAEHVAWMAMAEQDRRAVNRVFANVGKALEAYERKLVSVDADFDSFAQALRRGDADGMKVLSDSAKRGLKFYLGDAGCDLCHNGPMFSNLEFHNLGLGARDWLSNDDAGRFVGADQLAEDIFNAAGEFSDAGNSFQPHLTYLLRAEFVQQGAFKTPTLRNIAQTAPYMHGGEFETLGDVIKFYGDLQEDPPVGRRDPLAQPFAIDSAKVADLEAFLDALNGAALPPELTTRPAAPK